MNDCEFTLELSDGTEIRVGSIGDPRYPDVKAFELPPGSLVPFSQTNLPSAQAANSGDEESFDSVLVDL